MGSKLSTGYKETIKTKNSTDHCFPQDTCGLNDPQHFTSDQYKVQSDEVEGPIIGDHETQESEGGEADLHKHRGNCKKNPGHKQFIPVDTFTKKHLPGVLQDIDLYEYIKATADLTVRVDVKMSSPRRPKFWPKTTQPYPFYNMSEKRNLRTGSGTVRCVTKFQDGVSQDGRNKDVGHTNCCCRKCNVSESPSNVYWTLNVFTATHVVFDDIEASHTTLRLFYDRDDSPVISLDEVGVSEANIENDFCSLYCVTCDETVGNKLMEMYEHFYKVWLKFYRKYLESRSNHKLTFIVSHPHGCSKQVSVGQWEDMYKVGDRSQLTYTTCTCPGSSGAYVNCLGYKNSFWTWSECVHSKSLKSGLNSSGIGYL